MRRSASMASSRAVAVAEPRAIGSGHRSAVARQHSIAKAIGAAGGDGVDSQVVAEPRRAEDGVADRPLRRAGRARRAIRIPAGLRPVSCLLSPDKCARSRSCRPRRRCGRPAGRARSSPASASAPSNWPAWKFRVGSASKRLKISRLATVPELAILLGRRAERAGGEVFRARDAPAGSATGVRRRPRTAIALMLRAEDRAQAAAAGVPAVVADRGEGNRFSPAGPMTAKAQSGPNRSRSAARRAGE